MTRRCFTYLALRLVVALLFCSTVPPIQAGDRSIDRQRISSETLAVLRKNFLMSEVISLIQKSPDQASSRRYLQEQKRFNFIATQHQDPMVVDGYSAGDLKSPIIGYSLFYYGADGPLVMIDASVNPVNAAATERIGGLLHRSLDSMSNPDGSTLHFLGMYDFDPRRVLKIMIRKAQTPMGPDYAIRYVVSRR